MFKKSYLLGSSIGKLFIFTLWISILLVAPAMATVYEVTSTANSGPGTLRQAAIEANANPGTDTIRILAVGTIRLTSGEIVLTDDVTIEGPGAGSTTISGNNNSRIFRITETPVVFFRDFTLSEGNAIGGAGGAVGSEGMFEATNVNFINNKADLDGGGAFIGTGDSGIFNNCTFMNNTANDDLQGSNGGGGAASASGSNVNFVNCRFINNRTRGDFTPGGGLFVIGSAFLENCRFTGNIAFDGAGGLFLGTLIFKKGTANGNMAQTDGGAFWVGGPTSTFVELTADGNSAGRNGGGIEKAGPGTLNLDSVTVAANNAAGNGGGVNAQAGTVNTISSVYAYNTGANGPDLAGTFVTAGFDFIGNTSGANLTGLTGTNITNQNPFLFNLADNGGPTQTRAPMPNSPLIDKGKSSGQRPAEFDPEGATTDQRGFPRPVDNPSIPNAAGGDGTDIGAFEVQAGTPTPTPSPTPTPTPAPGAGLEGDLAPRPNGDGVFLSTDLAALQLFFAGTSFTPGSNEFQRADGAPYETQGDGRLTAADVQLMRNYIAQLAVPQSAGGPTEPLPLPPDLEQDNASNDGARDGQKAGRVLRVVDSEVGSGDRVTVGIEMDAVGDETVLTFTIEFDPAVLQNAVVNLAKDAPKTASVITNLTDTAAGRIGILIDSNGGFDFSADTRSLLTVTFDVVKGSSSESTPVRFSSSLVVAETSNSDARPLATRYEAGELRRRGSHRGVAVMPMRETNGGFGAVLCGKSEPLPKYKRDFQWP